MKYSIIASSLLVLSIFSGCSDDTESKKTKDTNSVTQTTTPKIEVVKNENAQQVKVEEKESDKSQSKSYYLDYNIKSAYDQNSQPANNDASVRVKPRSTIDANMNVRSPYEKVQTSLLVRKMSKKFIVKCSACHNDYANGIIGPSLLHKDTDYIFNKIADFKSGKKSNPLMDDLIKMMSDEEIMDMAKDIYKFNQEIQSTKEQ